MLAEVKLKEDTGMAGGRPAGSPPQTECRTHRPTDCDTTAVEHSTRGSTDIATGKSAPRPNPEAITCPTAEQMDMELDLKHELVELNRTRDDSKQSMQERLYNLHTLMAGTGRAGKLTPFLRDELKWPEKHAYDKAMRWIAAYELRAGLIDEETYRKRMGNGNTTSRSDSPATPDRPVAPPLHQTFTVEVSDDEVELAAPIFTSVEIATDALALEKRKQSFYSPVLMRAYYPVGLAAWFQAGWKEQARRHGTKTFADTLTCVILLGSKFAAEDDEWGRCYDEILRDIGMKPALALVPDFVHPEDRDSFAAPPAATSSAGGGPSDTVSATTSATAVAATHQVFREQTMDDFDNDVLGL